MKRLRGRLIKEFTEANKFKYRSLIFKYDNFRSVLLIWGTGGKRWIELKHISGACQMYREDYLDVPINILRASIKFLNEREKAKGKID